MRRLLSFIAAMFMLAGFLAAPAVADFAEDTKLCNGGANLDERIAACTRQISSGRWKGRDLSVTYNNRGYAYRNKGDYDRAIADHNEAIRLDPKNASAYSYRGLAYDEKGEYDRAIADHNEAIRLDPKDTGVYNN